MTALEEGGNGRDYPPTYEVRCGRRRIGREAAFVSRVLAGRLLCFFREKWHGKPPRPSHKIFALHGLAITDACLNVEWEKAK